ncbi:hypothetical protein LSH36_113g05017 [Paralvinella palmiformis]|uniref:Alternative oxidase n=1 Tax=Paralvinella palmiformis TaxID=53620 RepID=A0AAD9K0I8_9ANNE|nr:hypothetical protein LSH36_113g05017 [Paralvinella palmiformis]
MRVMLFLPRVLAQSARTTSLLCQLPKANYGFAPQVSRGFSLSQVLTSPSSEKGQNTEPETIDNVVADRIKDIKSGKFDKVKDPQTLKHFRIPPSLDAAHSLDPTMVPKDGATSGGKYTMPSPIYSEKEVQSIKDTHKTPKKTSDWLAYLTIKSMRLGFDFLSGYNRRTRDEKLWINRIVFMEAISAVPGMVAAMIRHLTSLRKMRTDHGWIHTLLEEAENERMHLMTALEIKKPTLWFKMGLLSTQGVFIVWFGIAYLIAPRYCHRFVGYLEEDAVRTFTKCLKASNKYLLTPKDIDDGPLCQWKTRLAPDIAVNYWKLSPSATMKDVILAMRADEAHHRLVNHTLASMNKEDFNSYRSKE